ncbi:hypothetical protein BV20DRAFT_985663 [Pilatotrama ljubarskyi]|nr:hypothetical protein BV20DRAFT_985663 [Pilatotrama ljubarskyi]
MLLMLPLIPLREPSADSRCAKRPSPSQNHLQTFRHGIPRRAQAPRSEAAANDCIRSLTRCPTDALRTTSRPFHITRCCDPSPLPIYQSLPNYRLPPPTNTLHLPAVISAGLSRRPFPRPAANPMLWCLPPPTIDLPRRIPFRTRLPDFDFPSFGSLRRAADLSRGDSNSSQR